jgi:hypothetical protein
MRNDRRSPATPAFGKPGKSFPQGSKDHPTIVEEKTIRVNQTLPEFKSVHPDTSGCYLTIIELSPPDNTDRVARLIYETLPGPWVPYTRVDNDLGLVQGRSRFVLATTPPQAATITATGKTTFQARDNSVVVSIELQEAWSNGTGTPSGDNPNTAYPTRRWPDFEDRRGNVVHTTQMVVKTGSEVASEVVVGSTVTKTYYEPIGDNQFLLRKHVEVWTVQTFVNKSFNESSQGVRVVTTHALPNDPIGMSGAMIEELKQISPVRAEKTTTTWIPLSPVTFVPRLPSGGLYVSVAVVDEAFNVDPQVPNSRARRYRYSTQASYPLPRNTAQTTYERRPYPGNALRSVWIQTNYEIPDFHQFWSRRSFAFPTLFQNYRFLSTLGTRIDSRPGFSKNVPCLGQWSFLTTPVPLSMIESEYKIQEAEWRFFSFSGHGLTNGETIRFTAADGTTIYEPLPESVPSRSAYESKIGKYVCIEVSAELWMAGIIRLERYFVKLQ